jgi:hypothetical protein
MKSFERNVPMLRARFLSFLWIAISVVAVLLVLTELTLRVLDFPSLRLDPIQSRADFAYDSELGWLPRPNSVKQQTAARTVTLRHNSLGLRDIEFTAGKGPTIVFLGNSFVWGVDVEAEERFTERLRADLPGVRIVNAGVPGYGAAQQYVLLERLWPKLHPTVVVLILSGRYRHVDTSNYAFHAYKPYIDKIDGRWQIRGQPVPRSAVYYFYNNWLAKHSALMRLVLLAYEAIGSPRIHTSDHSSEGVVLIRNFVEAHRARFLVGLQKRDAPMEALLTAQKIPYTTFDGAEVYPAWGRHWTPAGHALVAQRIEALLAREGLIPKRAPSP